MINNLKRDMKWIPATGPWMEDAKCNSDSILMEHMAGFSVFETDDKGNLRGCSMQWSDDLGRIPVRVKAWSSDPESVFGIGWPKQVGHEMELQCACICGYGDHIDDVWCLERPTDVKVGTPLTIFIGSKRGKITKGLSAQKLLAHPPKFNSRIS